MAGDERVVGVSGEAPLERTSWIMARLRYQTRLVSNSTTVVGIGLTEQREMWITIT